MATTMPQIDPNTGERIQDGGGNHIDPATGERIATNPKPAVAGLPPGVSLPGVPNARPDLQPVSLRDQFESEFVAPQHAPANETTGHRIVRAASNFGGGAIGGATAPILHPIQTVKSIAHMAQAAQGDPTGMVNDLQPAVEGIVQNPEENIPAALGSLVGGAVAGEAAGSALPAASRFARSAGTAVRDAAIGDPNAAALKGLRVGPGSRFAQRTIQATEGARPYLQGAQNLEDLQAKVPAALNEVWGPYKETIDAIGDKPVQGPNGPTTIGELEAMRKELSALNRGLKKGDPASLQLAQQKGLNQADLLAQEKAVQNALDPHLEQAGIDPKLIRKTFGQISDVGGKVMGRSTLAEPSSRFGLGRAANLSIKQPLAAPGEVFAGARDIVAGRPLFSGKATDVNIREAFRNGGPKPDLGSFDPQSLSPQLTSGSIITPPPADASGAVPYTPPPVDATTTPMRMGRLLPSESAHPTIPDAEYTMGSLEGRTLPPATPSVVTPAPDAAPQLPSQAGPDATGVEPPVPIPTNGPAPPPVQSRFARTENVRPIPAQPIPPRGGLMVTPEGQVTAQRGSIGALPPPRVKGELPAPSGAPDFVAELPSPPPPVSPETATTRTRAPLPPNPQPTPPGRTVVSPEGVATPERKLLTAPKSGQKVKIGDEVTVNGRRGTVRGVNNRTGKLEVDWK